MTHRPDHTSPKDHGKHHDAKKSCKCSCDPPASEPSKKNASAVDAALAGGEDASDALKGEVNSTAENVSAAVESSLRADLEQAKDRIIRCQAELDNYRKRAARELQDSLRYADMDLLRDLLPVLDNIQRAIEAAEKSSEASSLLEGCKMVFQQLEAVLAKHDCKKIEALHAAFDPHRHQAILQQPSEEFPAGTILLVAQEGYQLHDRVVRPSQVIVSTAPTPAE